MTCLGEIAITTPLVPFFPRYEFVMIALSPMWKSCVVAGDRGKFSWGMAVAVGVYTLGGSLGSVVTEPGCPVVSCCSYNCRSSRVMSCVSSVIASILSIKSVIRSSAGVLFMGVL